MRRNPILLYCLAAIITIVIASPSTSTSANQALAGEPTPALPRYRLATGDELVYHENFVSDYTDLAGPCLFGQYTIKNVRPVRHNSDGSWRIVLRTSQYWWSFGLLDYECKAGDAPNVYVGYYDVFPDGRIVAIYEDNDFMHPEDIFPALPRDSDADDLGWQSAALDHFTTFSSVIDRNRSSGDAIAFDRTPHSDLDAVCLHNYRTKFVFSRGKGAIERAEFNGTSGYPVKSQRWSKTALASVIHHDERATKQFAAESERFFNAEKEYNRLTDSATDDLAHADATFEKALAVLKDARGKVADPAFTAKLASGIAGHKGYAKYLLDSVHEADSWNGRPAPDWTLVDLDGHSHSLADYRGKVVLLDFFYRSCVWCIRAMPQVEQLAADFRGRPVAMFGWNDGSADDGRFVVRVMKIRYPVLQGAAATKSYGVHAFPSLFVIDQKGIIRHVELGYSADLHEKIAKIIENLLRN